MKNLWLLFVAFILLSCSSMTTFQPVGSVGPDGMITVFSEKRLPVAVIDSRSGVVTHFGSHEETLASVVPYMLHQALLLGAVGDKVMKVHKQSLMEFAAPPRKSARVKKGKANEKVDEKGKAKKSDGGGQG